MTRKKPAKNRPLSGEIGVDEGTLTFPDLFFMIRIRNENRVASYKENTA